VNEDFRCPKQRTAQLLCPAQAAACLEALFPERLYLATPAPRGVSHPPARQDAQLVSEKKTPAHPPGRQASQPKAPLRLPEGQGHARKQCVRLPWNMDELARTDEGKREFARKDRVRSWA
jgi:hypothetical protein